ncbi:winged helix DNA-binding domain-containing protein [Microbacterium indicum]|uniref:winged helix DNA-binding domain-containing protein n=1 Tax=Microbacterium indicum TaxID=358100 RepID=UPI000401D816|nr:winged helix DNA-binding domain-containing protein [Microbacterium indicum]
MDLDELRRLRLRHHRLTAPARSVADAARHMLCVQSQDLWGGRLALAARTRDARTSAVDRAFDHGAIVRSWTQRGTLHTIPAADLRWVLGITARRTLDQAATRRDQLGLDDATLVEAERILVGALEGGRALTRAEAMGRLSGIGTEGGRGYHLLFWLALRGVICWGPTVARPGLEPAEQRIVLVDEWIPAAPEPADPVAEMFVRYVDGHGPATADDFAWWSGLTKTASRDAAARAGDRVRERGGRFVSGRIPRTAPDAADAFALPTFEEYYIGYADRSPVAADRVRDAVGPGRNGIVRPVIVAAGEVVGAWRPPSPQNRAAGQATIDAPGSAAAEAAVARALAALRG